MLRDRNRLRDRVSPPVRCLLVGINPGVRSAQLGRHFAGYSNRFWKLLHESGLTPVLLSAEEDHRLPEFGFGVTNLIPRCTPGIDTLRPEEYAAGLRALKRKVRVWRPQVVALVGVTLFRAMFPSDRRRGGRKRPTRTKVAAPMTLGLQAETLEGATVFVLPNPSGRNANYSYDEMLAAFVELRKYLVRLQLA